jgi:putative ABC transport system permease protein
MGNLLQDIQYSLHMAIKKPGFTLIVVFVLALGIGANTAMFSVINAVLLRPLPYKDSGQLMALWEQSKQMEEMSVAYPNFLDWQQQNRVFDHMAAFKSDNFNYTEGGGDPERKRGKQVSADFFTVLGVNPIHGRGFSPDDDKPGANPAVIISHAFWQNRLSSNPSLIGQPLKLNGKNYTLTGVLPADFEFNGETDIFVPLGLNADKMMDRGSHPGIYVVGRLKQGLTIEQARASMANVTSNLGQQYPESNAGNSAVVISLYEDTVGNIRTPFLILLGAVALVLLIACANVANLLLARSATRQKEMAIRGAVGATRSRLVRQLLTESVLLSLAGGLLGLLIAVWGIKMLMTLTPPDIPRTKEVGLDFWVLGFTLLVSLVTGIIFGLAPALQASKVNINESLKEGGRSATAGSGTRRVSNMLVIGEIAISLMLLISAGLMIKSFLQLRAISPGFDAGNLLTMQIALPPSKYPDKPQQIRFVEQLSARVATVPGVKAVGMSNGLPLGRGSENPYLAEGQPAMSVEQQPIAVEFGVSPDYFSAMNIPILKGRAFTDRDTENAPKVAIIDESLARKAFPNQDPIGKRLTPVGDIPHEIVGLVPDVKHYGLEKKQKEQFYLSYLQHGNPNLYLLVRTTGGDPMSIVGLVRSQVSSLDKDQPVYDIKSMEERLSLTMAKPRFNALLLGIFAAVALILSVVGIYGVISYSVNQRIHEIGLRIALGAQRFHIFKMVVGQGLLLALIGIAAGIAGALLFGRVMASLLFGVITTDVTIFACVSLLLAAVAFIACYLPARKATRVDPMVALRNE